MRIVALAALGAAMLLPAAARTQAPQPPGMTSTAEEFEAKLSYRTGRITIGDGLATLDVPPGFRYLDPEQSERVLVKAWGNPPGARTLGMLFPAAISPLSDSGWGVIITYDEDGYVKDEGAEQIDYARLLKELQENARAANDERRKAGYPAVEVVGWAAPPRYDRASHKLYWAKELAFTGESEHTLNYNIRVLGRRGVLVLNAVASMPQLGAIERDMQAVLAFTEFNDGHRYADFKPGTDKVAEYGIGALVLGTVAAKTGLLKALLAGLLAFKKLVLVGLAGVATAFKRLFGRKDEATTPPPAAGA